MNRGVLLVVIAKGVVEVSRGVVVVVAIGLASLVVVVSRGVVEVVDSVVVVVVCHVPSWLWLLE
jgi:hypothetical protein